MKIINLVTPAVRSNLLSLWKLPYCVILQLHWNDARCKQFRHYLLLMEEKKKIEWNNSNCLACNLNFNLGELLWTNWKASKEKYFHRYAWTLERHQWRIEGPGCFRVIYLSQHSIARFTEHHCIEHGMNKSIWARFWRKKALQMLK